MVKHGKNTTLEGVIRVNKKKEGRVLNPKTEEMIYIEPKLLNTALDQDQVRVTLHPGIKNRPQTGEVDKIIARAKEHWAATIEKNKGFIYAVPDDQKVYADFLLTEKKDRSLKTKDKVVVRLAKWDDPKKNPLGKVIKKLGRAGSHETEIQSIMADHNIITKFPPSVINEAKTLKKNAEKEMGREVKNRKDYRTITTFTIDPVKAKDFDDALSYQKLSDQQHEVGIHIADVSFYVKPQTALDREAFKRGTSVYLVDRTIPMLPEILSNDLCSLNPDQDRLAWSAIFTMNDQGKIIKEWFGPTVINSNARLTYEQVQETLDQKSGSYSEELSTLNHLAHKLREQKIDNGALSFEDEEVEFILNEHGSPMDINLKHRTEAHQLVEDFMLLANKKIAEYASRINKDQDQKFVYRVHDQPDPEKICQLANFLNSLGYELKIDKQKIESEQLNQLLAQAENTDESYMVNRATIRAMSKAVYATKNIGHWGLAFSHYTHFTSPIRRYPDLLVHRLMNLYYLGEKPDQKFLDHLSQAVTHASKKEQEAAEAERDSIRFKQVEFMQGKIGQEFTAIISGVTEWGLFVEEISTKAEGLIKPSRIRDDYYELKGEKYALIGKNTGRVFRLGDKIKVKLIDLNIDQRQLDFELADDQ